jgi:hypothetical protein
MTEEPKLIIPQGTGYIETEWYDVDATKLTSAKDIAELLTTLEMRVSTTCENFDKVKKFLIIPEEPKGIEYYQKELDEKFEKLIEQYKRNSYASTLTTESNYDWNFDRIIENFEYARENGSFPQPIKWGLGTGTGISALDGFYLISGGSGDNVVSWSTEFNLKSNSVGYYHIDRDIKFNMTKKPNFVVRFCMDKLLGFKWENK